MSLLWLKTTSRVRWYRVVGVRVCCAVIDFRDVLTTIQQQQQQQQQRTFSNDDGDGKSQRQLLHIYEKRIDTSKRKHVSSLEWNKDSKSWTPVPAKDFSPMQDEVSTSTTTISVHTSFQEFTRSIIHYFLPARYPHSVADGYARFASLGFFASIAASASMVLSTQTLLLAVGIVGSSSVSPQYQASIMAGALNWVLKDGIGQLGGVFFASYMGQLRSIDTNPKQWRIVAAVSLDVATLMEITSPLWPAYCVLPLASVANIGKNIGFLTASASRAALHQTMAISNNLADVTAKAATQSMAASLLGTALGIGLSCVLQYEISKFALAFVALSVMHQVGNYASLQAVPLTNWNRHRLHVVLQHYISTQQVLTPMEVAQQEQYLPFLHPDKSHEWLSVGSNLATILPINNDWSKLFLDSECPTGKEAYRIHIIQNKIHVVFLDTATGKDLIRGMLHVHLLHDAMKSKNVNANTGNVPTTSEDDSKPALELIVQTYQLLTTSFSDLQHGMEEKGWKLGDEYVNIEPSRAVRLCIQKGT